jgi:hypothetical protein
MTTNAANFSDMLTSQLLVTIHCHDYIMKPENSETANRVASSMSYQMGARGSVVVKALCYKLEGCGFGTQ